MRSDKELDFLEEMIPELANSAVNKAYVDTLSSGKSVIEAIDGVIYEIFPNGTKKIIKKIENDIDVSKNKKLTINATKNKKLFINSTQERIKKIDRGL